MIFHDEFPPPKEFIYLLWGFLGMPDFLNINIIVWLLPPLVRHERKPLPITPIDTISHLAILGSTSWPLTSTLLVTFRDHRSPIILVLLCCNLTGSYSVYLVTEIIQAQPGRKHYQILEDNRDTSPPVHRVSYCPRVLE